MYMELLKEKINKAIREYTFDKSGEQAWREYCRQYAIATAELSGIYDPEHDEIEAIHVSTEEDGTRTAHVHIKKSPIEVISIDLIVGDPDRDKQEK